MNREHLAAEARTWVGTPYQANQRTKGIGADCIGVVVGAALECGLDVPGSLAYSMRPNGTLQPYLDRHMLRISTPLAGDVLLMSFIGEPHHLAFYIQSTIVHAYAQARKCVEQPMTGYWWDKLRGVYRFKEFASVD